MRCLCFDVASASDTVEVTINVVGLPQDFSAEAGIENCFSPYRKHGVRRYLHGLGHPQPVFGAHSVVDHKSAEPIIESPPGGRKEAAIDFTVINAGNDWGHNRHMFERLN